MTKSLLTIVLSQTGGKNGASLSQMTPNQLITLKYKMCILKQLIRDNTRICKQLRHLEKGGRERRGEGGGKCSVQIKPLFNSSLQV